MHMTSPDVYEIRRLPSFPGIWTAKVHVHFEETVSGEKMNQHVDLTLRIALAPETPASDIEGAFLAKAREVLGSAPLG